MSPPLELAYRTVVLLLLAWLTFSGHAAGAASFDCSGPRTSREKAICADPILSKRDEEVATLYRRAQSELSPIGREALLRDERLWLHALDMMCPAVMSGRKDYGRRPTDPSDYVVCLRKAYIWRTDDLGVDGLPRGGSIAFDRLGNYCAKPVTDSDDHLGWMAGMSTRRAAVPQIDSPATPAEQRWNHLVADKDMSRGCDGKSDYELTYTIGLATPRIVSVAWRSNNLLHGDPPRDDGKEWVETYVLGRELRPLTATDLFDPTKDWGQTLDRLLSGAVQKKGAIDPTDFSEVNKIARDPRRWFLLPDGLQVEFHPDELGSPLFTPTVKIPWATLAPLMVADPPIPGVHRP